MYLSMEEGMEESYEAHSCIILFSWIRRILIHFGNILRVIELCSISLFVKSDFRSRDSLIPIIVLNHAF